jgi:drug/metabolite transporter (DMT)-like permease
MSNEAGAVVAAETPPRLFAHPNVQMSVSIVLSAAAQLSLKAGVGNHADAGVMDFAALQSGWVWLGIAAMIGSLFSWLYALRFVALSVAFTLSGAIQALVPFGSWLFLGETISITRWMGISLVIAGVVISAKPATIVEEKL